MSEELEEQPQISPGKILKDAREALNLTTQNIADKVRLKNSLIQDIEADNYDANISLTFLKGYLKLYAKQVGIPEALVINAFDSVKTQNKEPAKLQSFSKRIAHQAHDDKLMLVTYLIVGLVIALVVIWWLQQSSSSPTITTLNPVVMVDKSANITKVEANNEDNLAGADTNANNEQDLDTEFAPTSLVDDGLAESTAAAQEIPEANPALAESEIFELDPSRQGIIQVEEPPLETIDLVFTFASDCWMKLTDAKGEDIAYGTKTQGRVMSVSGTPPFAVILCSPEVVKITYDGQDVDLSGFRQGVTAKFNLPFTE